jgi:predicted RNase H-like HicB family nuclease
MKYPALIKKEKDGKYSVSFPDFKGGKFGLCVSCGDTLQEAKKNAEEALSLHVLGLIEDAEFVSLSSRIASLPTPSIAINIEV